MSYVEEIKKKYSVEQIKTELNKPKKLKVLLIGDVILDRYKFAKPKGRALKDPILSVKFVKQEMYYGGVLVIANHLSTFVDEVRLVTLVGDQSPSIQKDIEASLNSNVKSKFFVKPGTPTTIKERVIDFYRGNKLFKLEYINDKPISPDLSEEIVKHLEKEAPKYDLVIVSDFGHGFINDRIRRTLEGTAKFLAVNSQTNSANWGYNYITKYKKTDFVTINEHEVRLPLGMRFEGVDKLVEGAKKQLGLKNFLITHGKYGCTYTNNGSTFRAPVLTRSVKDTIGSGDALFSLASLLNYCGVDDELLPFLANCAGGMAAKVIGNKESMTHENLLGFIQEIYNG